MSLITTLKFSDNLEITINHPKEICNESIDMTFTSIWPSSILLSLYLLSILPHNQSQTILEFGAGLGLIAQVILQSRPIKQYILQEWPDEGIVSLLNCNLGSFKEAQIITGKWGDKELHEKIAPYPHMDFFIMADCFYSKKAFPFLLSSISFVLKNTNVSKAICIYHHRNVNDSISKYIDVFDLNAKIVEFSPELHRQIEDFKSINPELSQSNLLDFRDLFIIEFTRNL